MRALFLSLILFLPFVFAGDCNRFSIGECFPLVEQIVSSQNIPCAPDQNVNECIGICQRICSITANCDFFSYDTISSECTLLRSEDEFFFTCDIVAGPGSPTLLQQCRSDLSEDSCGRFVLQDCSFSGNLVFNQTDVYSPAECQAFQRDIGDFYNGVMFRHDVSPSHLCQLLDSEAKSCTAVAGPPSPDYGSCDIFPARSRHTNTTPSTTTPTTTTPTTTTPTTTAPTITTPTTRNATSIPTTRSLNSTSVPRHQTSTSVPTNIATSTSWTTSTTRIEDQSEMDKAKSSSDIDFNHVVFESVTVSGDNVDHIEQMLWMFFAGGCQCNGHLNLNQGECGPDESNGSICGSWFIFIIHHHHHHHYHL